MDSEMKDCPYCSEPIRAAAIKCRHCGERLDSQPTGPAIDEAATTTASRYPAKRSAFAFFLAGLPAFTVFWMSVLRKAGAATYDNYVLKALVVSIPAWPVLGIAAVAFMRSLPWLSRSAARLAGAVVVLAAALWLLSVVMVDQTSGVYFRDNAKIFLVMLVSAGMAVIAGYYAAPTEPPTDRARSGGYGLFE